MDPTEARSETLALHGRVRRVMRDALELATDVERGHHAAARKLHDKARELVEAVRTLVDVEEHDLAPVLATIDAWGAVRREGLEQAHTVEERAISDVEKRLSAPNEEPSPTELARAVHHVVREVLRAMRWEEKHLLDPEVLRSDPVVTSQFGG